MVEDVTVDCCLQSYRSAGGKISARPASWSTIGYHRDRGLEKGTSAKGRSPKLEKSCRQGRRDGVLLWAQ